MKRPFLPSRSIRGQGPLEEAPGDALAGGGGQRALIRALLNAAPLGAYLVDQNFRICEVNEIARPAFGDMPGLIGRDFAEVIHQLWSEEYADEVVQRFRHTLETGEPYSTPERIEERRDRGVVEYYEWQVNRIPLGNSEHGVVCYFRDISQRLQTEQQIVETKAESGRLRRLYETILSNTPDLAYVFDLDHRFSYANEVLLRMWGRTWDEAIGKNCLELGYEPWHAAMHDREIEQVIATKKPIRGEVPFTGTFGRRIYDYIFVPVLNAQGEVEAIAGTTRDVTDRKAGEEALRASEERLNLALDGGQMGLWEWDIQNNRSVWNAKEYELLGLIPGTGSEATERFLEIVHADDLPRLQKSLADVMREGADWREEFRVLRADGEIRWLAGIARVYRDAQGRPARMIGINYDITERKQEEAAARRDRERIDFLTNAAQVGLWFCDLPFDEFVWDQRAKEHFWLPPAARVTIDTFFERLHPEDRERTRAAISESIANNTSYNIDHRTVSPDGQEKWIRAIGHAQYGARGEPIRFDGVTLDITDSKRAEVRSRFLLSLDDALRPLSDPQEITLAAARMLGEHLRADRCAYADVEADEDAMNLSGNYLRGPAIKSIVGRLRFSDFGGEVLQLMRANKPYVVEDIDTHQPPVADRAAYRATQIQSVICVPLHKAGRLVAAMAVHLVTPRRWRDDEVELVSAVAARCWESIERVRLARGLRETEQRFRQMADSAPVLIWQTDETGIVFVNRHYLDFFGATFDEVKAGGWTKYLHPDDQAAALEAYTSAFRQQAAYDFQCRFRSSGGDYRWLHNRGVPHRGPDGSFLGFFGSSADVTELKQSEKALRASEERFRAFVTTSWHVIYRMSPDWSEMRQLTGKGFVADTEAPIQDWMAKYIHPQDQELVRAMIRQAIDTRTPFELEHRVIRVDGTPGWTHSRAVPLSDSRGNITEWFGAASDITERHRAEEALRLSEDRYRSLFESIDEGFCVIEMIFDERQRPVDYRFIEVNPAFERQTGVRGATGKRMLEFVSHIEPHWLENYGKVAMTGEPIRFADEYKSLGSWFDVYAFRVGSPESRRVAVLFNNITKRKEAEDAVLRSRAELAAANEKLASRAKQLDSLVERRTAELRETVQQLETFSYSIVHDMRAPLRSMRSFAGILQDDYADKLDGPGLSYLRRIMDSSARMDALITDVLNYSKVSMQQPELSAVDLNKLIPDIVEQYPQFQEKAALIRIERPLPRVRGNTALLTQVFSNLLGNALKFVPRGAEPSVRVRAEEEGDSVRVWVEDKGIGISDELQGKIFGLFQRLHGPHEYPGTGVGLAIVKRAVEKMEGQVGLESKMGQGSRFWVRLLRAA